MKENNMRVVVLVGSSLANLNTLSTLIDGGNNIVGAVVADQKTNGINTKFLKSAIKKQGIIKVSLQIAERVLYKLLNRKKDQEQLERIFDKNKIKQTVEGFSYNIHKATAYDTPETLAWIKSKKPDLIVIHTPYWVSKKVRNIVNGNVIGGHPGITQHYRGVHSPFWAIYNNDYENIGYSIFWVSSGVDSGDLIYQGKITPQKGDSYIALSWKGMAAIAARLNNILSSIESVKQIDSYKNDNLKDETIFYHPTIFNYIKYRLKHKFR